MCEMPDFCVESHPRAARTYRCEVCRYVIPRGEVHFALAGKWADSVETVRCHEECHELYALCRSSSYDDCLAFSETLEDVQERGRSRRGEARDPETQEIRSLLAKIIRRYRRVRMEPRPRRLLAAGCAR